MILFFLSQFPFSSSDFLSDHLTNNVNVTIDPCDDFFLHVCSQSVNSTVFPISKISKFYEEIAEKFHNISNSPNLSIMNDILRLNSTTNDSKPSFNRSSFENLVRIRCKENDACYREEFDYFSAFYINKTEKATDRLKYFKSKLNQSNIDEILTVLIPMVESYYDSVNFSYPSWDDIYDRLFYGALTNRLFVMEELKENGIFERIVNIDDDLNQFKNLIINKFRKTPWLNEKDNLGLSFLSEFEDKMTDMIVYYDLDENDRDLKLLRIINSKFTQLYYKSKLRSTGNDILDIHLSLNLAFKESFGSSDAEEEMLVLRVEFQFAENAFYMQDLNRVAVLAPFLYPVLADNSTLNKHYRLFFVIGHEIFHSVVLKDWANKSNEFKNGMECMNEHYNRTCEIFGKGSCNSGKQTFEEDGSDLEGFRITHEFLVQNYIEYELKEVVFESDSLSVNREQAFFYLFGMSFCRTIKPLENHTDVHSPGQVRVNGVLSQTPAFSSAFSCNSGQKMYAHKDQMCSLFGPDSK